MWILYFGQALPVHRTIMGAASCRSGGVFARHKGKRGVNEGTSRPIVKGKNETREPVADASGKTSVVNPR